MGLNVCPFSCFIQPCNSCCLGYTLLYRANQEGRASFLPHRIFCCIPTSQGLMQMFPLVLIFMRVCAHHMFQVQKNSIIQNWTRETTDFHHDSNNKIGPKLSLIFRMQCEMGMAVWLALQHGLGSFWFYSRLNPNPCTYIWDWNNNPTSSVIPPLDLIWYPVTCFS